MKIVRYLQGDTARVGIVKGDGIVDVASRLPQYAEVRAIAAAGQPALDAIEAATAKAAADLP